MLKDLPAHAALLWHGQAHRLLISQYHLQTQVYHYTTKIDLPRITGMRAAFVLSVTSA